MKRILLLLAIVFLQADVYSQQLTFKELRGAWDMADTSNGKMTYQFTDSVNMLLIYHSTADMIMKSTYTIELINNLNRLYVVTEDNGAKMKSAYRIKLLDANTFKLQIDLAYWPLDWTEEKGGNTATFKRRKEK